jgi:hypothetical protein
MLFLLKTKHLNKIKIQNPSHNSIIQDTELCFKYQQLADKSGIHNKK